MKFTRLEHIPCVECPKHDALFPASECECCEFGSRGEYGEHAWVDCTYWVIHLLPTLIAQTPNVPLNMGGNNIKDTVKKSMICCPKCGNTTVTVIDVLYADGLRHYHCGCGCEWNV